MVTWEKQKKRKTEAKKETGKKKKGKQKVEKRKTKQQMKEGSELLGTYHLKILPSPLS